eukprot:GSMAST32.ASY1.ANO1.2168.1 assembled CDS
MSQCFEYIGNYDSAINLLDSFREYIAKHSSTFRKNKSDGLSTNLHQLAILLLLLKLCYCAPYRTQNTQLQRVTKLLKKISNLPIKVQQDLRRELPTHWGYKHFIQNLVTKYGLPCPVKIKNNNDIMTDNLELESIYHKSTCQVHVLGDSHCLSLAWRQCKDILTSSTRENNMKRCVFIPHLITGLKAWHLRGVSSPIELILFENEIHTTNNRNIGNIIDIILTVGEIDCREGIITAVGKKKYVSFEEAVQKTVQSFLEGIHRTLQKYPEIRFFLMPVPPPTLKRQTKDILLENVCRAKIPSEKEIQRAKITRLFNMELRKALLIDRKILGTGKALNRIWLLDYATDIVDVIQIGECNLGEEEESHYEVEFLSQQYECDGTHCSPAIIPLVEKSLQKAIQNASSP